MFKDAYLYIQRFGKENIPILHEVHTRYGNICLCDRGLADLAKQLSSTIHVHWGDDYQGRVKVRNHAPAAEASYSDTRPLSKFQMKIFSKALDKGIKPNWVDERQTKEYESTFNLMKKALRK